MRAKQLNKVAGTNGTKTFENNITIGTVVDTNDPQQMGRLRVTCPAYGDNPDMPVLTIPWAVYVAPFAGVMQTGTRGRSSNPVTGPTAYGMWAIPKVGSNVFVFCLDGDPSQRCWFGALFPQYLTHTFPHGRYSYSTQVPGKPEGPFDSAETQINPLYDNQTTAFTGDAGVDSRQSFEFRTRAADTQAAALTKEFFGVADDPVISKLADDRGVVFNQPNGEAFTSNQGYAQSQIEPDVTFDNTGGTNYDPQTYGWVTPGGHAISFEDRKDNCRVRIRTTGGAQILIDDTNERMTISTAQGETWIELDEKGTIDIFCSQTLSVRSKGDINFQADKTFRVMANGIHLNSTGDLRLNASGGDVDVHTSSNLRVHSNSSTFIQSDVDINLDAASNAFMQAGSAVNIKSGSDTMIQSGATMNVKGGSATMIQASGGALNLLASASVLVTGTTIELNGPTAAPANPANPASPANEAEAFLPSRTVDHEAWARVYNTLQADQNSGNLIVPEYDYNNPNVGTGSQARGINFDRNPLWRR